MDLHQDEKRMPEDHFRSARMRLKRAEHHIRDLKRETEVFVNERPWTHAVGKDATGRFNEHKIKLTRAPPDDLCLIVADAVHSLRSALDQSGAAAARASGVTHPNSSAFPFGLTPEGVMTSAKGRSKNIPPDILALMCAFKPYKTGNPLLWHINHIRNVDDHALLKPMAIFVPAVSITSHEPSRPIFVPEGARWNPANNEIIFAISPTGEPDPDYDFDIRAQCGVWRSRVRYRQTGF